MAIKTFPQNPRSELERHIGRWESRWRFKTVLLYLPRTLLLAFSLGILATLIVVLLRLLSPNALLMLVLALVAVIVLLVSSVFGFFGKSGIEAARKFDQLFGLQERLSTAFELLDGRIKSSVELAELQIRDTLHVAENIDAKKLIRLEWRKWEWAASSIMGALLTMLMIVVFANGLAADGLNALTEEAIRAAASTTQDITEVIATDNTLSDEERQQLLDSAETTLSELQNPDTSAEDAFAAMSELEADLSQQAQQTRQDIAQSEQAMTSASEALGGESNGDPNQLGQQLNNLSSQLENMSPAEQQEAAENLQEAADAMREENPAMAENLDNAAEALQNGDAAAASDALSSAAQNAQQQSSQNAAAAESAQSMEDAAEQAQQSSEDIATSEYNENAQTEGQIDPNSTIEEQLGMPDPEIASMPQDGGGGSGGGEEPTNGTQGDLVESDDPNARPADTQGNQEGQDSDGEGRGEESNSGAGSGEGEAPRTNELSGGAAQNEVRTTNNTDGEGETAYDQIYAPMQEDPTAGQDNVQLETEDGAQPAMEGNFQENPTGQSTVPYNQVFGSYADEANRALENAYVPLGVRDVVRDYFTSIEPTGNSQP